MFFGKVFSGQCFVFQTYVMNACKEDSCYITLEYEKDMKTSQMESAISLRKNPDFKYKISRDYVLPDFTSIRRGYLKVSYFLKIYLGFH